MTQKQEQLEKDLIGLLLTGTGERFFAVSDRLKPEHFTSGVNQAIYLAIQRVHNEQSTFSISMVESRCKSNPDDITISAYLGILKAQSPENVDENDLVDVLIDRWYRRTFVEVAQSLHKIAGRDDVLGFEIVETAIAELTNPFDGEVDDHVFEMGKVASQLLSEINDTKTGGLMTGIGFFDKMAAPLMPGQLVVVAGATSSGKSSLVQLLSWKMSMSGNPVFIVSNEMSAKDTTARALAQMSGVPIERIMQPWNRRQDEIERTEQARDNLQSIYSSGFDKAAPTVGEIRLQIKKHKRLYGVRAAVIDHLQFIAPDDIRQKRHEQLAQITSGLKAMAKDLEIPVILVSHLTREDGFIQIKTAKDIRRPTMNRLFGSSSIEKDADLVMFVHRPYYFLERNKPANSNTSHYYDWMADMEKWKGKAEIILAKRRQGKGTGIELVAFDEATTLFRDLNENTDQEALL